MFIRETSASEVGASGGVYRVGNKVAGLDDYDFRIANGAGDVDFKLVVSVGIQGGWARLVARAVPTQRAGSQQDQRGDPPALFRARLIQHDLQFYAWGLGSCLSDRIGTWVA